MPSEPHENIYKSRKEIFFNNFLGGIAWALGATIGVSLLLALISFIASKIDVIPIFGSFVSDIIDFVITHNKNFTG